MDKFRTAVATVWILILITIGILLVAGCVAMVVR